MMANILSFRDWESSAVGSGKVLGETRATSYSTYFSALQQMRKKFFEVVSRVLRDPGRDPRRMVARPLLVHFGDVVQLRQNARLLVGNLQLEHFAAGELALANAI